MAPGRCRAAPERCRGGAAVGDENRWQPPGFVQQVGFGAESHRRLQYLAGVAGVGDRPLRIVGLVAAVPAAHVRVAAEAAGGQQHSLACLDVQRRAVADDARAYDPAVLDDEILHRGIRPQRRLAATKIDQHLEHLSDE